MRILLLTPALPYPPHQGGALRNYGIIDTLARAGHQVTLLSFTDSAADCAPLRHHCTDIITIPAPPRSPQARLRDLALTSQPDLAKRLYSPSMAKALDDLLAAHHFDIIQFEGLEMAIYLPKLRARRTAERLIYDAHNAEAALQAAIARIDGQSAARLPAALYSHIQARRVARFERAVCAAADAVIAVSDEDAAALRPYRPDGHLFVLPNGIFVDHYAPTSARTLDLGDHALVFTGKMDYRPNIDAVQWFTNAILPPISAAFPDVRFYVVGQKPHPQIQMLAGERVAVTGWVEQVHPFLHGATVYVAPLRMGSGTRLKLLEALAARRPVVATPTAAAGLHQDARASMRLAEGESAFAQAVIDLLGSPQQRQQLAEHGYAAVRHHYDWSALAPRLLSVYESVVSPGASTTQNSQ